MIASTRPELSLSAKARLQKHAKSRLAQYAFDLYCELHIGELNIDTSEADFLRDIEGSLLMASPTPQQFH